jgi:hypothetical protein
MTRQQMLSRAFSTAHSNLARVPAGTTSLASASSCRAAHTRGRIISLAGPTTRESSTAANWKRCLHARACHLPSTKRVRTRAVTAGRVGPSAVIIPLPATHGRVDARDPPKHWTAVRERLVCVAMNECARATDFSLSVLASGGASKSVSDGDLYWWPRLGSRAPGLANGTVRTRAVHAERKERAPGPRLAGPARRPRRAGWVVRQLRLRRTDHGPGGDGSPCPDGHGVVFTPTTTRQVRAVQIPQVCVCELYLTLPDHQ